MKYRRWGVCFTLFFVFVFAGIINDSSYVSAKETIYEYDDSGRVTKVVYEDGSYTEYVYDANGNLLKTIYVEASDVPSEEQSTTEQQNDSEENENNGANNISDSGTGNPENGDEHANGGNIGTNVAGTTGNMRGSICQILQICIHLLLLLRLPLKIIRYRLTISIMGRILYRAQKIPETVAVLDWNHHNRQGMTENPVQRRNTKFRQK